MLLATSRALGSVSFYMGAVTAAHTHLAQGIALYDAQQHRAYAFLYGEDTGVTCRSYAAWTLWLLGYPAQAWLQMDEALGLAQQIAHPFSLSFALCSAAIFHQLRREEHVTQERAEATIVLATEQGFPFWTAGGSILCGWALARHGQAREGIAQLIEGLRAIHATGAEMLQPYILTLLAEVHGTLGEPEAGLTALAEALTRAETTGERWYESEIYRLKGELLLQQNAANQAEAETCFQQAITVAQNQQAKSWELRAATSLARLWQQQGKRQEAHDLLASVYNWFTEGFDTADLKDAKALLDALGEQRHDV